MEILTYALLSYLFVGLSHTIGHLRKDAQVAGTSRVQSSLGRDLIDVFFWPIINLRFKGPSESKIGRRILVGGLSSVVQWLVMAGLIDGLYALSVRYLADPFFRIMVVFSLLMLGVVFLPLNALVESQVQRLMAWISRRTSAEQTHSVESEIRWCGTCRHHQKMSEYEDLKSGLWHDAIQPASDQLPCRIVSQTATVWRQFYATDPMSRTIFPKNCPHYAGQSA